MKGVTMRSFRSRMSAAVLSASVLASTVLIGSTAGTATAGQPQNAAIRWNTEATDALIVTGLQSPPVSIMHLAMVHGAMYDAVNSIDRTHQPYLGFIQAKAWYSKPAAAATAAHAVLVSIVPTQADALDDALDETLAGIADGASKDGGVQVGQAAAAAMITARTGDGRFGTPGFPVGTLPGEWRPELPSFVNDPAAWIADVDPFVIADPVDFRTDGPAGLRSDRYARQFKEVKRVGSATSTVRTADQTDASLFWSEHPPAMWSRVFRELATSEHLSIAESARFFASLYVTAADALISAWVDKRHYLFWRPITAIRLANTDGNPVTTANTEWLPLLASPPYPDHPSGHASLSGSIVATLRRFFGTDDMEFGATSVVTNTTRTFDHFSEAIDEIVDARVWSGIHFRAADVQAARLGRQVSLYVAEHEFGRR